MTTLALVNALLLKPAALAAAALGMTAVMRRTGASARHAVWTVTIGALLALPLLALVLPDLRIRSLDAGVRRVSVAAQNSFDTHVVVPAAPKASRFQSVERTLTPSDAGADRDHRVTWTAFLVWALVAVLLVSRRIAAEVRVHRMVREMGVRVEFHHSNAGSVRMVKFDSDPDLASPAVVGLIHPMVLLPRAAASWSETDLEAMLAHELGHAARRDCLTNLCADLAASVYWCNPLVRLAARRLRLEGERACDERVLHGGTDPRAYAELLLRVAHADRCEPGLTTAATAMSRVRELESRLVALLDGRVSHEPVSRGVAALLVAVGVAITLPAAALTVSAAEVPIVGAKVLIGQVMAPEPDRRGDSLASPASERVPLRIDERQLDRRVADALSGEDSVLASRLLVALRHTPTDEGDLVRERARWVFAQTTNGRLITPLLESLSDGDWRVQAYAAWALAIAGDARAVPQLVPLVRHPVWRLRAMAAYALRESGDRRAFDAMRAALGDPAWQVRVEAVEYFAAQGGDDARELIRQRLDDRHIAVRLAVQSALGIH